MKPRFSQKYLAGLFEPDKYENLVEINALLSGSDAYEPTAIDYGLGSKLFLLLEGLTWFASAHRSGSVTYFESTRRDRQTLMLAELLEETPTGFATHYELGMSGWRDAATTRQIDAWLDSHDRAGHTWLWALSVRLQPLIISLLK